MPYKNTDTNSSIAQQLGTWRYFNSGFQKLGQIKGSVNIATPSQADMMDNGYSIDYLIRQATQKGSQKIQQWNKYFETKQAQANAQQRAVNAQMRAQEKFQAWRQDRPYQKAGLIARTYKSQLDAVVAQKNLPAQLVKAQLQYQKAESQRRLLPWKERQEKANSDKAVLEARKAAKTFDADVRSSELTVLNKQAQLAIKQKKQKDQQQKDYFQKGTALISQNGLGAYLNAVRTSGLLYGDNPIAQLGLKQAAAKAGFGAYMADVMADIDAGKYNNVPVEQALTTIRTQFDNQLKEISKAGGWDQNDPDFMGFAYKDSFKQMIKVRQKLLASQNATKSSQAVSLNTARITNAIQQGQDIPSLITHLNQGLLSITKAQDQDAFIKNYIQAYVDQHPNAYKDLGTFLDQPDPLLPDLPIKARLSGQSITELQIKANNNFIQANADAFNALDTGLRKVAQQGRLQELLKLKARVLLGNGNVEDDYTKLIDTNIQKARSVKNAQLVKQQKKAAQEEKATATNQYINDLSQGKFLNYPSAYGTTQQAVKVAYAQLAGNDPKRVARDVSNLSPYNPARTFANSLSTNIVNTLRAQIREGTYNKAYKFEQPPGLKMMMDMYRANPSGIGAACDFLKDPNKTNLVNLMFLRERSKFSYHDIMRAQVQFNENVQKKDKFLDDLKKKMQEGLATSTFDGKDYGYSEAFILTSAMGFYQSGCDQQTSIKYAISQFKQENIPIFGGWVPKNFLNFNKDLPPQDMVDILSSELKHRMDTFTNLDPSTQIYVTTQGDSLVVRNRTTAMQLTRFSQNDIKTLADSYIKDHSSKIMNAYGQERTKSPIPEDLILADF